MNEEDFAEFAAILRSSNTVSDNELSGSEVTVSDVSWDMRIPERKTLLKNSKCARENELVVQDF